jgi:hypothetical protein
LGGEVDVHKKGLVTHIDATGIDTSGMESVRPERGIALPFPERDLGDILTRQHLVETINWDASDQFEDSIGLVLFPAAFTVFSNIMNKLSNFAYIRYDVEVEVRPLGSPAVAGLLMASWLPFSENVQFSAGEGRWMNPVHIDLGAPAATVFTIPFVHWNYAATLPFQATGARASEHSVVRFFVEHPLRSMTAAVVPSVTLQVFARMKNVQLGGDVVSNINTARGLRPVEDYSKEELLKLVQAIDQGSSSKPKDKKKVIVEPIKAKNKTQADIGDFVSGTVKKILGEGQSDAPSLTGTLMGSVADAIVGTLGTRPPDMRSAKIVSPFYNYNLGGSSAASIMQPVLNHKSYLVDPIPYERFGDDCSYDKLNDLAKRPGLITQFHIEPAAVAGTIFKTIAVTPNWSDIVYTTTPGSGTYKYQVPTPAAHVADHFLGWRGSNKYLLRFTGSQFAPAVVGWTFFPYASAIPDGSTILQNQGDTVSGVINVVGPTTYKLEIPYMSPGPMVFTKIFPWEVDEDSFNTGYLVLYLISPIAGNATGANANIHCSVWHAVGDDFQWYFPQTKSTLYTNGVDTWTPSIANLAPTTNLNPPVLWYTPNQTQALISDFKTSFMMPDKVYSVGATDNASESAVTFRDVIMRPRPVFTDGGTPYYQVDPYKSSSDTTGDYAALVPRIMRCFRFWRGSRTTIFGTLGPAVALATSCGFIQDGANYYSYLGNNYYTTLMDQGVVVPWLCLSGDFTGSDNPYTPTGFITPPYFEAAISAVNPNSRYRGFGDDFQFGGLVPPSFIAQFIPDE